MIHYRRGAIKVLDSARLETAACECYRVIRKHCKQLLLRSDEPPLAYACERPLSRAFG